MSGLGVRQMIARKLRDGPAWARSYQAAKRMLDVMVEDGEIERIAPEGQTFRNMVVLTPKGAQRYFPGDSDVFVTRAPTRAQEREAMAEAVANGSSILAAGRALGISEPLAKKRWREIVQEMGGQAV